MRCVATAKAFYNARRINPGDKFNFDGDEPPSWAVAAEDYEAPAEPTPEEEVKKAVEARQGPESAKKAAPAKPAAKKAPAKKGATPDSAA